MSHAFSQEFNCSPWEGLLWAVRVAAGKLAYCERVIGTATSDLQLEGRLARNEAGVQVDPDTGEPLGVGGLRDLSFWVAKSELWHERLARVSKLAVDAGVAERVVEAQILQVQLMTRPVEAALAALDLTVEQESVARHALRTELLAIEAERVGVIVGSSPDEWSETS
jgi:hypothetical protein